MLDLGEVILIVRLMLNSIQGEYNLVFLVTDGQAKVLSWVKLDLKFSVLVRGSIGSSDLSLHEADWHLLSSAAGALAIEDLSYYAGAFRAPSRFETKVDVVVVGLIEKLPRRHRTPYPGRNWLQVGIE